MNVVEILSQNVVQHPVAGRVYGVVIGIVTTIDDPSGQGRVKANR